MRTETRADEAWRAATAFSWSVIVPCRNEVGNVKRVVERVAEFGDHVELIFVDDGSTDNTAEVVRAISDKRVRYLRQENRGVAAALNTAWRAARGEYLALLGSDDVWLPRLLETLLPVLEADARICLIYARAQGMDANGRPLSQILGAPEKFPGETLKSLLYGDCVCGLAAVFRRGAVEHCRSDQADRCSGPGNRTGTIRGATAPRRAPPSLRRGFCVAPPTGHGQNRSRWRDRFRRRTARPEIVAAW